MRGTFGRRRTGTSRGFGLGAGVAGLRVGRRRGFGFGFGRVLRGRGAGLEGAGDGFAANSEAVDIPSEEPKLNTVDD